MRSAFPPMGCTLRGQERSANHRAPSKVGACFEHQPARGSTVFPDLWQSVCVAVVWRHVSGVLRGERLRLGLRLCGLLVPVLLMGAGFSSDAIADGPGTADDEPLRGCLRASVVLYEARNFLLSIVHLPWWV
jgi:hypothetical protein